MVFIKCHNPQNAHSLHGWSVGLLRHLFWWLRSNKARQLLHNRFPCDADNTLNNDGYKDETMGSLPTHSSPSPAGIFWMADCRICHGCAVMRFHDHSGNRESKQYWVIFICFYDLYTHSDWDGFIGNKFFNFFRVLKQMIRSVFTSVCCFSKLWHFRADISPMTFQQSLKDLTGGWSSPFSSTLQGYFNQHQS